MPKARRKPALPGYDGRFKPGAKTVIDPYSGKEEVKWVNTRHDALENLFARKKITAAQKEAGDRIAALHVRASGAGARGMDYADDRVDGGGVWKDIPASQLDAMKALAEVSRVVGKVGYAVLIRVACDGCSLRDVVMMMTGKNRPNKYECDYVSRTFRDALDELAVHFRLQPQNCAPSGRLGAHNASVGISKDKGLTRCTSSGIP